jgi:hypothetical protein
MAYVTLPWAPVATLISSLPLAGGGPGQRLQNRCSGGRDAGSWKLRHGRAPDKPGGRCADSRIVR